MTKPLDTHVLRAIQRRVDKEPSDPFIRNRLITHYLNGIWSPQDDKSE